MYNQYQYEELRAAATRPGAAHEEIDTLGEWFNAYGMDFWNGEYFDADGIRVYPVVEWDDELDAGAVVGYEIR